MLRAFRISACAALCALMAGCASYERQARAMRAAWVAGDYAKAAAAAQAGLGAHGDKSNRLVWQLEAGAARRAAGEFAAAEAVFENADDTLAYWDEQPDVLVSREAAALLVNQANLPYRGATCDRIMLGTYRALDAMALGDAEAARVQLNRVYQRQRDAVDRFNHEIEAAQKNTSATQAKFLQSAQQNARLSAELENIAANVNAAYAPFVNPFSVWLDGVFFAHCGEGASDAERARVSLERAAQMAGAGALVAPDLARLRGEGESGCGVVYVVLETGVAPWRREVRIDAPTFLITEEVPYMGIALPALDCHPEFDGSAGFTVMANGAAVAASEICDMNAVVAAEFQKTFPSVLARALLSAAAKASAQYGLRAATKDSGGLGALAQIAGVIYQAATNQADLRTWSLLPRRFYAARIEPIPENRTLAIVPAGGAPITVVLGEGRVVVVYLKNVVSGQAPSVSQFPLVR